MDIGCPNITLICLNILRLILAYLIHKYTKLYDRLFNQQSIYSPFIQQKGIHELYLSMHILTKYTHKQHVMHFSNNNTQNGQNLGPIKNWVPLGSFTVHYRIIEIQKHPIKPKDISPRIKTKPNTVQDCSKIVPKILSRLSVNNPKNLARTVRKQS